MAALSDMGRYAVRYLEEFGWAVIPLWPAPKGICYCGHADCSVPGKHPAVAWGGADLNPDLFDLAWVKEKWGYGWNIAIPTGPATNIMTVDFDKKSGGLETYETLVKRHGEFPKTPTFDSGGGGFQQVYQYPGGYVKSTVGILPGVDIRAFGSMFVAPPSLHRSGTQYKWRPGFTPTKIAVPPLPPWLLELCANASAKVGEGGPPGTEAMRYTEPAEGTRNAFVSSWLGSLRNLYPKEIATPLILTLAKQLDQNEDWALDSIERIYRKPAIRPGRSQYEREVIAKADPETGVQLLDIKEAWNPHRPKPRYLVERFLAERDITAIVAPPEMGKSLISLHIAIAVAGGKPVFGEFAVPLRQKVLYVNAENPDEMFYDRIRDIANGLGLTPEDLEGWLFITKEGNFDLGSGTPDSIEVEDLLFKHDIKLVVLDSLVSFLKGNPDNAKEVRTWFDTVARDWRKRFHCSSVLLHHENKGDPKCAKSLRQKSDIETMKASRNSSDIPAAVERYIALEKEDEYEDAYGPTIEVYLRMAKARRGDKLAPVLLRVENVDENKTVFSIKMNFADKSVGAATGFIKEILLQQRPLPAMPLKNLAVALAEQLKVPEIKARKWIMKVEAKHMIETYTMGGNHNEKMVLLCQAGTAFQAPK